MAPQLTGWKTNFVESGRDAVEASHDTISVVRAHPFLGIDGDVINVLSVRRCELESPSQRDVATDGHPHELGLDRLRRKVGGAKKLSLPQRSTGSYAKVIRDGHARVLRLDAGHSSSARFAIDRVTSVETITLDSTSDSIQGRKKSIRFELRSGTYDKTTQYHLVLRDAETDAQVQSVPVVIDRSFDDDF